MSQDDKPGSSGRLSNQAQHQGEGAQRTARPGLADFAEQAMFNRVPLGGSRWLMANRHRQPQPIRQFFLKVVFPDATAGTVGTPAIGFNEQVGCAGKALG